MSNQLTIKGQVTIPKQIRDFLGLTAGRSAVQFVIGSDGVVRVIKAQDKIRNQNDPQAQRFCNHVLGLLRGNVV